MKTLSEAANSGIAEAMERVIDLMDHAGYSLLADASGLSGVSYVALMTLWRQVDASAARLCDAECVRGSDGRYRLREDSVYRPDEPDYRVDVTSPT